MLDKKRQEKKEVMGLKMSLGKKGQMVFIGIMVFVIVFIMAVQFITPLKDQIIESRDAEHLDCDNETISTGQSMTCIAVDIVLPYFFSVVLAAAAGYLTIKSVTNFQ